MKGNPVLLVATLALGLAAVGFIAYPYVSNWLNQIALSQVSYQQAALVEEMPDETLEALWLEALDYNGRLAERRADLAGDPYGKQMGTDEYRSLLDVAGDGVMGSISIPSVNVQIPIYHGVAEDVLLHGVGHLPGSSLPVGGSSSHAVLTGHTGLPSARYFDDLEKMRVGDWFVLEVLGHELAYRVYRMDTVLPTQTESLAIQDGRDLCTLVTCTPYGVNTHRLLVHAERIDVPDEWYRMKDDGTRPPQMFAPSVTTPVWLYGLAGAAAGMIAVIVALLARRRRKRGAGAESGPGRKIRKEPEGHGNG